MTKKLVLLLGAIALIGCGEKNESGVGADDNDEGAGDGVVSESEEAPASPESRLIGYWRVDAESTFKEWEENPPSHDFDAAFWKESFAEEEKRQTETLQFLADGKVTSHGLYGESGSYAIKTSDNDSKDLEVEMEIEFFGSGKLFFSPSRKTLTLPPDLQLPVGRRGPPVVLIGIDETEAKERIEKLTELPQKRIEEAPFAKLSPFTEVSCDEDKALVTFSGKRYELVSIDGLTTKQILYFCRKAFAARWEKRFAEDLVEVMSGMGREVGSSVNLALKELDTNNVITVPDAPMTADNRRAVWKNRQ